VVQDGFTLVADDPNASICFNDDCFTAATEPYPPVFWLPDTALTITWSNGIDTQYGTEWAWIDVNYS
jgi:hypothetical protein